MRKIDFDEDGALSEAEVEAFFKRPENSWATDKDFAWFSFVSEDQAVRVKGEVVSELQGSIAKAVVDFHDLDKDGKISGSELYTSLWQWKALVQRKKALTKLYHKYRRKRADSEDVRKFEIDFLHKHAGCSLSGRLKAQAACHRLTELEAIQASTARVAVPLFRVISGEEDGQQCKKYSKALAQGFVSRNEVQCMFASGPRSRCCIFEASPSKPRSECL
eukprot:symbB.v1.2.012165.t1/scaffold832.1/size159137/10